MRIFIDAPLESSSVLPLDEPTFHYISHVMRAPEGQILYVFNGREGEWETRFRKEKKKGTLEIVRCTKPQVFTPPLALLFSPLRTTSLEWMVQKATELGVTDFYPLLMDHTAHPFLKEDRLKNIIKEAIEQCERMVMPCLHPLQKLGHFLPQWSGSLGVCLERSSYGSPGALVDGLLIGPEGGFSEKEKKLLLSYPFVVPISLGSAVLRAETAALAALSLRTCGVKE